MKHEYETQQVKEDARGRWERVLLALAPPLKAALERTGKHVPCPVHGGRDGFRLFRDVADTGGGICNTCGSFANGICAADVDQWLGFWPDDPRSGGTGRQPVAQCQFGGG